MYEDGPAQRSCRTRKQYGSIIDMKLCCLAKHGNNDVPPLSGYAIINTVGGPFLRNRYASGRQGPFCTDAFQTNVALYHGTDVLKVDRIPGTWRTHNLLYLQLATYCRFPTGQTGHKTRSLRVEKNGAGKNQVPHIPIFLISRSLRKGPPTAVLSV